MLWLGWKDLYLICSKTLANKWTLCCLRLRCWFVLLLIEVYQLWLLNRKIMYIQAWSSSILRQWCFNRISNINRFVELCLLVQLFTWAQQITRPLLCGGCRLLLITSSYNIIRRLLSIWIAADLWIACHSFYFALVYQVFNVYFLILFLQRVIILAYSMNFKIVNDWVVGRGSRRLSSII